MNDNKEIIKRALQSENPQRLSRALADWLSGVTTSEEYAAECEITTQNDSEKEVINAENAT